MATKKKASKGNSRVKTWFSLVLPIVEKNAGLTVSQKKQKAEDDCKKLLKQDPKGRFWDISSFKWSGTKKHRLTVRLKKKPPTPGPIPPGDPTVPPPPRTPPPSM